MHFDIRSRARDIFLVQIVSQLMLKWNHWVTFSFSSRESKWIFWVEISSRALISNLWHWPENNFKHKSQFTLCEDILIIRISPSNPRPQSWQSLTGLQYSSPCSSPPPYVQNIVINFYVTLASSYTCTKAQIMKKRERPKIMYRAVIAMFTWKSRVKWPYSFTNL